MVAVLILSTTLLFGSYISVQAAEPVEVRAAQHSTHGRLVLDWAAPVSVERRLGEQRLQLRFDRPFSAALDLAQQTLETYVTSLEIGDEGRSLDIGFQQGFGLQQLRQYEPDLIVIDFAPNPALLGGGAAAAGEAVGVRIGDHDDYVRLVFDFARPVQHWLERSDRSLMLTFDQPAAIDAGTLGRELGSLVDEFARLTGDRAGVRLLLKPGIEADVFGLNDDLVVIDFRLQTAVQPSGGAPFVRDVSPSLQHDHAEAVEPPSSPAPVPAEEHSAKPGGTEPGLVRVEQTEDDRAASSHTAEALEEPATPAAETWPELSAALTDLGIELSVRWPSPTSAAVFRRGGHLWLVFDAPVTPSWRPSDFGPVIRDHLGRVEVLGPSRSREGEEEGKWSILRLPTRNLPEPEVTRVGTTWKILLGPTAASPDYASVRRSADLASLRVVAVGARQVLSIDDPTIGDRLLIWPIATPGTGSPAREFVELALMPTAQGMVLRPLSDAVTVGVADGELVVAAENGLNLSAFGVEEPETRLPMRVSAESPTRSGGGSEVGRARDLPVAHVAAGQGVEAAQERLVDGSAGPRTAGVTRRGPPGEDAPTPRSAASLALPDRVHDLTQAPAQESAAEEPLRPEATARADAEGHFSRHEPARSVGGGEIEPATEPRPKAKLGLSGWAFAEGETAAGRRVALMQRLAQADEGALPLAKLDLARFFLAQAMAAETLAVLDDLDDRALADLGPLAPVRQGLSGAADLLMGRLRSAEEALESEALDRDPEIALWRAVLAAAQHQWDQAARELGRSEDTLASYPPALQLRLGLPAAMISVETGRPELAFGTLDRLGHLDLHPSDQARLRFIRGLAHARVGQIDEAIALWQQVEGMADEETRIKASFAMATTLLEHGRSDIGETLARLLQMRPLWRGHAWEPSMLDRLAGIQAEAGDVFAAIRNWQDLATRHPAAADRMRIDDEIRITFERAWAGPGDHPLAPLRVLALIEEQPELMPPGEDGRNLRQALAGRLAGLDLVEPAIDLFLAASAGHPLSAADGASLASLHLRAMDPTAALDVLDTTAAVGLDQELLHERARLRARALMDLDQLDDAAVAIRALNDPVSADLRADILWRQRDWPALAKTLERRLADAPSADLPLARREQELVVRLAVAHAQLGAGRALADLRSRFTPAMDGTAMGPAFLLASAPREPAAPNALLSTAERQIETIRAFLDQ